MGSGVTARSHAGVGDGIARGRTKPPAVVSTDKLRRQIMDARSRRATGARCVGVSVRDCRTNDELVLVQPQSDEDRQFIPASNLKLITSGVAMLALGADYEFKTTFVVQGNRLIIRASGDPAGGTRCCWRNWGDDGSVRKHWRTRSWRRAAADRRGDHRRPGVRPAAGAPGLAGGPVEPRTAPVSGLNFTRTSLDVRDAGGRIGERRWCGPTRNAPWLEIDRRNARTVSEGTRSWIQHGATPTKFLLHGSVRGDQGNRCR